MSTVRCHFNSTFVLHYGRRSLVIASPGELATAWGFDGCVLAGGRPDVEVLTKNIPQYSMLTEETLQLGPHQVMRREAYY